MSSPASAVTAYALKVWIAGLSAAVFVPLSIAAAVLDTLLGRSLHTGLAGRVLRASAELEATLDLHGELTDIRLRDDATPATA